MLLRMPFLNNPNRGSKILRGQMNAQDRTFSQLCRLKTCPIPQKFDTKCPAPNLPNIYTNLLYPLPTQKVESVYFCTI